jgi:LuxR family maltose regulon positive regulatory protein
MMVVYKTAVVQAEIHLMLGNLAEAKLHLDELEAQAQANLPKTQQIFAHLSARYWAAYGQPEKALHMLDELAEAAQAETCLRRLIGAYVAQALVQQTQAAWTEALASFALALRLAATEGYVTLFFPHEGWQTRSLLQASQSVAPEFVNGILERLPPAADSSPPPAALLPEPLTEQEINVLALIVNGRSNQDIADELVISVGTAKWHVHNIYQKLDVSNRGQAIAKAHDLGLT